MWLCNSFPLTIPYVYPMGLTAQTASVYLTVVVTIERYIVVCWALRARYLCTVGRAKLSIIIVCLCSILYNASRFAEYDHVTTYFDETVRHLPSRCFQFLNYLDHTWAGQIVGEIALPTSSENAQEYGNLR